MEYRMMELKEAERIREIDATYFIKNAWREIDGELCLVEINWTDYELPNGLQWHLSHFSNSISSGGCVYGCFDNGLLVGYGAVDGDLFGTASKYLLLDQLFVSKDYRNKHIGRTILSLCADWARAKGADKLYICAGSSEDTVAFYRKMGCVNATEINEELYQNDTRDLQLELCLI